MTSPAAIAGERVLLVGLLMLVTLVPDVALAQGLPAGVCTTDIQYAIMTPAPGYGMASQIVFGINNALMGWMQTAYLTAVSYAAPSIAGAVTVYVVIYGIFFTLGLVPINVADVALRVTKVAVVAAFASGASWSLFNGIVVQLFNGGVDYFIGAINSIAVGMAPGLYLGAPFAPIDNAITLLLSARMVVTLIGFAFTGPYGLVYVFLIIVGIVLFARCVLEALWTYLLSLVVRTLLLGLAPIFVPTLLFSRTRHIFNGWLNQILNTCFQPIFLFMFFGFFSKIVEASVWRILSIPVCWTPLDLYEGSPLSSHFWRPAIMEGGRWVLYGGEWTLTGIAGGGSMIFPLNIIEVGIFLIVAMLALRFNTLAVSAAKEIAGASTSLNVIGQLPNLLSKINHALKSPTTQKLAAAGAAGAAAGGLAAIAGNLTSSMPGFRRGLLTSSASTSADGSTDSPDGSTVRPDGSVVRPDGSILRADGATIRPDGNIVNPDGTVVNQNGEVIDPLTNQRLKTAGSVPFTSGQSPLLPQAGAKPGWADKTLAEAFLSDQHKLTAEKIAAPEGSSQPAKGAAALLKGGDVDARLQALEKNRGGGEKALSDAQRRSMPGLEAVQHSDEYMDRVDAQVAKLTGKKDLLAPAEDGKKSAHSLQLARINRLSEKELERELRLEIRAGERAEMRMQRSLAPLEKDIQRVQGEIKNEIREAMPTAFGEQGRVELDPSLVRDFRNNEKALEKVVGSREMQKFMEERQARAERIEAIKDRLGLTMDKMVERQRERGKQAIAAEKAKPKSSDQEPGGHEEKFTGNLRRDFAAAFITNFRGERKLSEREAAEMDSPSTPAQGNEVAATGVPPSTQAREKYDAEIYRIRQETMRGLDPQTLKAAQSDYNQAKALLDKASKDGKDTHAALKDVAAARAELKKVKEAADAHKAMAKMKHELDTAAEMYRREETSERQQLEAKARQQEKEGPAAAAETPEKEKPTAPEVEIIMLTQDEIEQREAQQMLAAQLTDTDAFMRELGKAEVATTGILQRAVDFFAGASRTLEVTESAAASSEELSDNRELTDAMNDYDKLLSAMMAQFGQETEGDVVDQKHSWRMAQQRMLESMERMQQLAKHMDQQLKASIKAMHDQVEEVAKAQEQAHKKDDKTHGE